MPKVITDPQKINEVLTRGVEKIYPSREALGAVLRSGKRIRLYCGFDPTAPTLHLGNAIQIKKLAQFQKLGHEIIMLLGDFTGMIGDPTDKTAARKKMTRQQLLANAKNYKKQASKFLNFSGENPAKMLRNSQWGDKVTFRDLIEILSNFTVQQMIIRDMFQERLKENKPIYLHEFLYPLAQGYDSVAMDVDLEIGGADQTFNMLIGRDLVKMIKGKEKFVLTNKLLVVPGGKKMGKTEGNMITLDDSAGEIYGKVMNWPDENMDVAFELLTNVAMAEIGKIKEQLKEKSANPRDIKARLAREIVTVFHNQKAAAQAEKEFDKVFKERRTPDDMPTFEARDKKMSILDLLVDAGLAPSKSEAKRLIHQKAVEIDGNIIGDWQATWEMKTGQIIKVGKRKFVRII